MKVTPEMIAMLKHAMYSRLKNESDMMALCTLLQAIAEYHKDQQSVQIRVIRPAQTGKRSSRSLF